MKDDGQPDRPQERSYERPSDSFEGDYRPSSESAAASVRVRTEPIQLAFLMRLANALNATLDLQTIMHQTAELVRAVIDFRIFAILLLNDRTNDLRMRYQIGHTPETERRRFRIGEGIIGEAAAHKEPVLVNDVRTAKNYVAANEAVRSELAVPLIVKGRVIGVIDIESEEVGYFQEEQLRLLELTASRVAVAIENARLYTRVSRQAQTLAVLTEISRDISSILDLDELLERIGHLLRRLIDYQMFSILLLSERDQVLETQFAVRFGERYVPIERVPLNRGLVGVAMQTQAPVYSPDVRRDPRYHMVNPLTKSELAVPLIYKKKAIGVLDMEHTRSNYFNEDHQRTIVTLAAQIAIAIENARLYQRVAQQEQRLEHDLEMAREVQLRLLPQSLPKHPSAEFATRFLPARTIGGDLYDFLRYDHRRTGIALGDASGKAAPAALYAALVSGIMRAAAPRALHPEEMLRLLNDSLQERRVDAQYVTMVYAVWNDEDQTLEIANAGAVQPLISRYGEVETIHAEGFPLGLFPNVSYEQFTLSLRPGDSVVFFSDGLADAQNPDGEMFGTEQLCELVQENASLGADALADLVMKAISDFQAGAEHFDDETLIVLRVNDLTGGNPAS
ncbi:MAG TPA: SpoIIE family protein phosphatase [Acidobacteriaceae bacterium]